MSFVRTMIDHGINYCQTVTITDFVVKILMANCIVHIIIFDMFFTVHGP